MGVDLSTPVRKTDSAEKTAGRALYVGDVKIEGLLYAKTLRSTRPRARIAAIRMPDAPAGVTVVGRGDIPGVNRVSSVAGDEPCLAEGVVNYVGQPILLVVGEDKQRILDYMARIEVEYEDIPAVCTLEDADDPSIPPLVNGNNRHISYHIAKGDCAAAFAKAAHVVSGEYRTGYQEHIYLEPQGMTAVYEGGRIVVTGSMQCPYYIRDGLASLFGWGADRVCVIQSATGGGFGGKEEYPTMVAGHAALAAYKTGRPVRLVFDRAEDIEATTKRHPSVVKIETALDGEGKLLAMRADIRLNAGAYLGLSQVVLQRSLFNVTGVYNVPNFEGSAACVATNTVPNGAFRGFGAPQVMFAVEMHMHKIARELGLDEMALKALNFAKQGDLTATSGVFRNPVKLPELMRRAREMSGYDEKKRAYGVGRLRGIGSGFFLHGCGFTGNGERDFKAKVRRRRDGRAEILAAATEMGQGTRTTLAKIVAEVLEVPYDQVVFDNPNTDLVPNSGPTVASRTVIIVGRLLERAARELKKRWNEPGEPEAEVTYEPPAGVHWDNDTFTGEAYPDYSWGADIAEVEVDPVTFEVEVKGIWAVHEIGRAIDERVVRGQVEGGILQGVGYGLMENMESQGGRLRQRSVTDYTIPTAMDFPPMESALVENLFENGPFGAKGVGELTIQGAAPALASAVADALDVPVDRIPVTPEYLMGLVKAKREARGR